MKAKWTEHGITYYEKGKQTTKTFCGKMFGSFAHEVLSIHLVTRQWLLSSKEIAEHATDGKNSFTVLPANSDSDVMICLQSYQGLIIDRSLVY